MLRKMIAAAALASPLAFVSVGSAQYDNITPVTTLQLPRVPTLQCSVSADGPQFLGSRGQGIAYGGAISCLHGVGIKTLNVWVVVQGPNGSFYVKQGTYGTTGPRRQNPTWIGLMPGGNSTPLVAGHRYRVVAEALVTWEGHSTSGTIQSATYTDPGETS